MSENELRASRYIENFNPPDIIERSVHQVCSSMADAFLGRIEYGKDYVIRTELAKEDWADGFGTKYTYSLEFDELVRCKDCKFKAWDDAGMFCRKNIFMGKFEPNGFCSWGERRSE